MRMTTGLLGLAFALIASACSRTAISDSQSEFFGQGANPFLPKITLYGDNPLTLDVFAPYQEYGGIAQSLEEGLLAPSSLVIDADVNTSVLGTYTVSYAATDSQGRTGITTRVVNVVDRIAPTLTYQGLPIQLHEEGTPFVDMAVSQGLITASDQYDGDVSSTIESTTTLNPLQEGNYVVNYQARDSSQNMSAIVSREIHVRDTIAPQLVFGEFSPELFSGTGMNASISVGFLGASTSSLEGKVVLETEGAVSDCDFEISNGSSAHAYTVTISNCVGAGMLRLRVLEAAAFDDAQMPGPNQSLEGLSDSVLTVSTATPVAQITGAPQGFSQAPSVNVPLEINIFGEDITQFKYKVGLNADCSQSAGYSNSISLMAGPEIITTTGVGEGLYRICVVGGNAANIYQAFTSATSADWVRDVTPPQIVFDPNLWANGSTWSQKLCDLNQDFASPETALSGVSYLDNLDTSPTGSIVLPLSVDRLRAGQFVVSYQAMDLAQNSTSVSKTVEISGDFSNLGGEIFDFGVASEDDIFLDRPASALRPSIYDSVQDQESFRFVLCNSIDLLQPHQPLGSRDAPLPDLSFTGLVDGKNYLEAGSETNFSLRNLVINTSLEESDEIGLFASIGWNSDSHYGRIQNIVLHNPVILGSNQDRVGAMAGRNRGHLRRIAVEGGTVTGRDQTGGLVGLNESVQPDHEIQGLIEESFSSADVSGDDSVGGLVGSNQKAIINSYAAPTDVIIGDDRVGGLVGLHTGQSALIKNSYAVAVDVCAPTPGESQGGLVGLVSFSAEIEDSFWDQDVGSAAGGECSMNAGNGTPATTSQMQTVDLYSAWESPLIWSLFDGEYPDLSWISGP